MKTAQDEAAAKTPAGPPWKLTTDYTGGIRGGVSDVQMSNKIAGSVVSLSGMILTGSLEIGRQRYRLQNKRNDRKNFLSTLAYPMQNGFTISGTISDGRFFDRVITANNSLQDFTNNNQRARGNVTYTRPMRYGVSFNTRSEAGIDKGETTFENTRSIDGSIGGGVRWARTNQLAVSARGSFKQTAQQSEPVGQNITVDGLGGPEDSLSTSAKYWITPTTTVKADYTWATKRRKYMDLPRGVFLDQNFEGELNKETEKRIANIFRVDATTQPIDAITFNLTSEHQVNLQDYAVAVKRFNETTVQRWQGMLTYRMPKKIQLDTTLENGNSFRDFGTQSLGSYREERKSLRFSLLVPFSQTFSAQFQTGSAIVQTFYQDFDVNPRDRDQLDEFANMRVTSTPFPKIGAQVYLSASRQTFVNVDASLSSNNRMETTWDFRPEFTYTVNPRVEIKQTYGMNLEFTEFDYAADDNFLDRNFTFTNTVKARIFPRLGTEWRYRVVLHDRGSYLTPPEGGERLLDITQEDRRDEMMISFRYAVAPNLFVVGQNDYSQRKDQFSGSSNARYFRDLGLALGFEGNYDWGAGKKLDFSIRRVLKEGRFNSPAQKEYWEMDSTLAYRF